MASYETFTMSRNVEFYADIAEMVAILQDKWKKHQYEHQVTLFIVGYESTCDNRLALIRSVNEVSAKAPIDVDRAFPRRYLVLITCLQFFAKHLGLMQELEAIAENKPAGPDAAGAEAAAAAAPSPPFDEDESLQSFSDAMVTSKHLGEELAELNMNIIKYLNEQQENHPNTK